MLIMKTLNIKLKPRLKQRRNLMPILLSILILGCSSSDDVPSGGDVIIPPGNNFSNIRIHSNLSNGNLALKGYDPVSYIVSNEAVLGNSSTTSTHDDILYHFSSAANKLLFDQNPDSYVPQYGGWCATGMALNFVYPNLQSGKYPIDPLRFSVENGKLYLFQNTAAYDAYPDWVSLGVVLKNKATENWNALIN